MAIAQVHRLVEKLTIWKSALQFENSVVELKAETSHVTLASRNIMKSEAFSQVLRIVLSVGNILNNESALGAARGFQLEGLLRLKDVHTTDKHSSLLHVVVDILESKYPKALLFYSEIEAVEEARKGIE